MSLRTSNFTSKDSGKYGISVLENPRPEPLNIKLFGGPSLLTFCLYIQDTILFVSSGPSYFVPGDFLVVSAGYYELELENPIHS